MASKQISFEDGMAAIRSCLAGADCPSATWKTAVRWGLQELARRAPGKAVEVRVPPAGAVQILGGTTHRRGTPPTVVEMNMHTFVALAGGVAAFRQLAGFEFSEGAAQPITPVKELHGVTLSVDASGERADISHLFPLV